MLKEEEEVKRQLESDSDKERSMWRDNGDKGISLTFERYKFFFFFFGIYNSSITTQNSISILKNFLQFKNHLWHLLFKQEVWAGHIKGHTLFKVASRV